MAASLAAVGLTAWRPPWLRLDSRWSLISRRRNGRAVPLAAMVCGVPSYSARHPTADPTSVASADPVGSVAVAAVGLGSPLFFYCVIYIRRRTQCLPSKVMINTCKGFEAGAQKNDFARYIVNLMYPKGQRDL